MPHSAIRKRASSRPRAENRGAIYHPEMSPAEEKTFDVGLAIETSGTYGSVAIGVGGSILQVCQFATPRAHAVDFLPAVERLCTVGDLHPGQIRFVYVSIGPGSFTGLRIGVTAARAIAFSVGAGLVAVPTLDVIAHNALSDADPPETVVTMLDAKRKRVYAASYKRISGSYACQTEVAEVEPSAFLTNQPDGCAVLGESAGLYRQVIEAAGLRILPEETFRARAETVYGLGLIMANRGSFTDRRSLVPLYVRPPEAEERWQQRTAEAPKTNI